MNNSLVILTEEFPFGKEEVFLEKEIFFLSKIFDNIYIYPLNADFFESRALPKNCEVKLMLNGVHSGSYFLALRYFDSYFKVLFAELISIRRLSKFIKSPLSYHSILLNSLNLYDLLLADLKTSKVFLPMTKFYCVWNNKGAMVSSILFFSGKTNGYFSRFHGYDLYDNRKPNNYQPFQFVYLFTVKKSFILSKAGRNYLIRKYPNFSHKLILSYFGVWDNGISKIPIDNGENIIVSCSHVIPLKRVNLIAETLRKIIDRKIRWIHFGDGSELKNIKENTSSMPVNIQVEWRGATTNSEILEFYSKNQISLFIHLSETEGLGVAIIEAMSFGIPTLACDTGGVPELVNEHTGKLIPVNSSTDVVKQDLLWCLDALSRNEPFRNQIRDYWNLNFNAERIYPSFVDQIRNL